MGAIAHLVVGQNGLGKLLPWKLHSGPVGLSKTLAILWASSRSMNCFCGLLMMWLEMERLISSLQGRRWVAQIGKNLSAMQKT